LRHHPPFGAGNADNSQHFPWDATSDYVALQEVAAKHASRSMP